ncbi:MAG: galactose mutarotase [Rhodobacteraceae bacterium]|jgi:aldose 1-epimerase|nr:galactose mutarotase [Paracoccaceae bacterium]
MRRTAGELDGHRVETVTLTGNAGLRIDIMTYGARLVGLEVAGRDGQPADIALGYRDLDAWAASTTYIGATCGRCANRIGGAGFVLDGREIRLDRNEGANTLHGGTQGFDRKHWQIDEATPRAVSLTAVSEAGEMGFPGRMKMRTTYRIDAQNRLRIEMEATTDAPTVANIVNHAYFNLAGTGDVLGQMLRIEAGHYTPADAALIVTGEIRAVDGTAFDFRTARPIGLQLPGDAGFDTNFCLSAPTGPLAGEMLRFAAEAWDPGSGRRLRLWTTEPGLQFYSGGYLDDSLPGKAGAIRRFGGFALETQKFPDSPNRPQFPSCRLDPGRTYRHVMLFDFTPQEAGTPS